MSFFSRGGVACVLLMALTLLVAVDEVDAQYGWRYWEDEGADIDEDEVDRWRSRSRIREQIDNLDDREVDDLSLPILFGVTLNDLTRNFGDPRGGGTRLHEGLDILAIEGTPIVSPTEAVVLRVGEGVNSGLYVSTANPGGETFVYMHLNAFGEIEEGDVLERGDLIGYVGNTGNASGGPAHLHLEIRDGRTATDPFPRIAEEFSLEEKMEFLSDILEDTRDEDELALFLVKEYRSTFALAQVGGVELPESINTLMGGSMRSSGSTGIPLRDLTIGDEGADVTVLQSILIAGGYLDIPLPTGYFGSLTERALARYQAVNGIEPASGYYGSRTRAHMTARAPETSTQNDRTREELIRSIAELTDLVADLQRQLERLNR